MQPLSPVDQSQTGWGHDTWQHAFLEIDNKHSFFSKLSDQLRDERI